MKSEKTSLIFLNFLMLFTILLIKLLPYCIKLYVDNPDSVLQALGKLQESLEQQNVDWDWFIFRTSIVDISTNHSATKVINALKQNKTSSHVTSFVEKYLTTLFTYVTDNVLYIFNEYGNDKLYSEYEDNVKYLSNQGIDVNTNKRYSVSKGVIEDTAPILVRVLDLRDLARYDKQQLIASVVGQLCNNPDLDVNVKGNDGNPIAWHLIKILYESELTDELQQTIGDILDKLCSHKNFDVNAEDQNGCSMAWHLIRILFHNSKLTTDELQQKIGDIFDKLCSHKDFDVNTKEQYDDWSIAEYLIAQLYYITDNQQQTIGRILNKLCSHEKFDVNTKYVEGTPIALHLIDMLSCDNKLTAERQQMIGKVLDKLCSHEKFDVNAKDSYGNLIVVGLTYRLCDDKLTDELQQTIGDILDKLCSHEKFDVNAKDNRGNPAFMNLIRDLNPLLKCMDAPSKTKNLQILEQISDKLLKSPSDVNSVKDNDLCKSYEHQDVLDSWLQDEVDSNWIGLSGNDTSSCQHQDLICDG